MAGSLREKMEVMASGVLGATVGKAWWDLSEIS
jgi:hypothetical protein